MKRQLVLFCLVILSGSVFSQQQKIDSLKLLLEKTQSNRNMNQLRRADSNMVNLEIALGIELQGIDPVIATRYLTDAQRHSEQIDYKRGVSFSLINLGNIQVTNGDYLSALDYYLRSYRISKAINYPRGIAGYYYGMFQINYFQAKYPVALEYLLKTINIAEELKDEKLVARCYSSIGSMFSAQENYEEAIQNFTRAKEIFTKLNEQVFITQMNANIAAALMGSGKYGESLQQLLLTLENYRELNNKSGIAFTSRQIAHAYFYMNQYSEAEKFGRLSLETNSELGNKNGIAASMNILGRIKTKQKKYDEASKFLTQARDISLETKRMNVLKDCYRDLATLDSARGNYSQAFANYKLFYIYHDSIYNAENTQKITQQRLQYQLEKKQAADSLLMAHEKEMADLKLQEQRAMTYGGFGASAITILLLFFVYSNYKKQKSANHELKMTQHQLVKSEKLAAFGVMASRVSHEIQNPLNFVNNFSIVSKDLVRDLMVSDEEERKETASLLISNLEKIHEHGNRAASIIRELQEHSRKGTAQEFFES